MFLGSCCLTAFLLSTAQAQPAPRAGTAPASIYFLAIGSGDYLPGNVQGAPVTVGFADVAAPARSAAALADALIARGARRGILLVSDHEHLVSKDDIRRALHDLKQGMRRDRPARPVMMFYYMGHGLGDGLNNFLYLPPGNLVVDPASGPSQRNTAGLLRTTLLSMDVIASLGVTNTRPETAYLDNFFPTDLMPKAFTPQEAMRVIGLTAQMQAGKDAVERPGELLRTLVPFLALFDNCYGGVKQTLTADVRPLLGDPGNLETGLKDLFGGQMAALEDSGVAIYAAKPGDEIGDFPDPGAPDVEGARVGLLARRMLRVLRAPVPRGGVTLGDIKAALLRPDVQKLADGGEIRTPEPFNISATEPSASGSQFLPAGVRGAKGVLERRAGSAGGTAVICCGPGR